MKIVMPRSSRSQGNGHPTLFNFAPAFVHHPDGGGYAKGFLERAYKTMGVKNPSKVLHLCSGSTRIGTRLDIRIEMQPSLVADCRRSPFPDESFDWIMADPPYSEDYASNLYGTGKDYPKLGQIVSEACRLLRPGGSVGVLHFQVPTFRKPLRMVGVWGISTGCGYAIRAWTVLEKP